MEYLPVASSSMIATWESSGAKTTGGYQNVETLRRKTSRPSVRETIELVPFQACPVEANVISCLKMWSHFPFGEQLRRSSPDSSHGNGPARRRPLAGSMT